MAFDIQYLPSFVRELSTRFGDEIRLATVEELEAEGVIFIQDGNHGEYRPRKHEFVTDGVPFVRPANLIDGRVDLDECDHINEVAFERVRKGIGHGGDVVLTTNATIGRVAVAPLDAPTFVTNPQTTVWRSKNANILNQKYLYYFMCSRGFQEQLKAHTGRNATFDYVSLTKQRSLVVPLLPLEIQEANANVLSSFDEAINLNRRMNGILEGMARAIFKAWFVDFEPVKAKAAGATRFPGMPQPVFDQLPNRLVDSELGQIPEGWEVGTLGDYCRVNESSLRKNGLPPEIVYINISSVTVGRLDAVEQMRAENAPSRARRRVRHGDTIWSCVRPNRKSYLFIHSPPLNCIVSTGFAVLTPTEFGPSFLYQTTTRPEFVDYLVANATGSAYPAVVAEHFERASVVVPPKELRDSFESIATPAMDLVSSHERESRVLASIRHTLLPKLISGELTVPVTNGGGDG